MDDLIVKLVALIAIIGFAWFFGLYLLTLRPWRARCQRHPENWVGETLLFVTIPVIILPALVVLLWAWLLPSIYFLVASAVLPFILALLLAWFIIRSIPGLLRYLLNLIGPLGEQILRLPTEAPQLLLRRHREFLNLLTAGVLSTLSGWLLRRVLRRRAITRLLGLIGVPHHPAAGILRAIYNPNLSLKQRLRAVEELRELDCIVELVNITANEHLPDLIQIKAAMLLEELDLSEEQMALTAWQNLARHSNQPLLCLSAARRLWRLGQYEYARQALWTFLQTFPLVTPIHDANIRCRVEAARLLCSLEDTRNPNAPARQHLQAVLTEIARHTDIKPYFRLEAIAILRELGERRQAIEMIAELLHSPHVGIHACRDAARILSEFREFDLLAEIAISSDNPPWVRLEAASHIPAEAEQLRLDTWIRLINDDTLPIAALLRAAQALVDLGWQPVQERLVMLATLHMPHRRNASRRRAYSAE